MNVSLIESKKNIVKNASSAEAAELETKAYELYEKANLLLKESITEADPLVSIEKTNKAKETINYALLKQEQSLKKYDESKIYPPDVNFKNIQPVSSSENFKESFVYTQNGTVAKGSTKTQSTNESIANTSTNTSTNNTLKTNNIQKNETPITQTNLKTTNTEKTNGVVANSTTNNTLKTNNTVKNETQIDQTNTNTKTPTTNTEKESTEFLSVYEKLIKDANQIEASELNRLDKIKDLKKEAVSNKEKSEKILTQLEGETNPTVVQAKVKEAEELQKKSDAAALEAKNEEFYMNNNIAEAKAKRTEAILVLEVLEEKQISKAKKVDNKKSINEINKYFDENIQTNTAAVNDGIELSTTKKYNNKTIIPIDVVLPEGLIFKVQIGAFKNKINPTIFNGISPITGELTGKGITRYTAGMFRSFKAADMAKGKIRNLGYNDAFVVVFFNGKRISEDEAEKILSNKSEAEKTELAVLTSNEINQLKQAGINENEVYKPTKLNPTKAIVVPKANQNNAPIAESINNLEGVYFTVQIGVFKNNKTSEELFNITPLQTFTTETGLIRYSTGVFRSVNDAEIRKTEVVNTGITDAYVVAYKNGKRITVEEATGQAVLNNQTIQNPAIPEVNQNNLATKTNNTTKEKAVFKVQLGAYKGEVNIAKNTFLNQLTSYGIQFYVTQNGFYIYTAGEFTSKAKADELRQIVLGLGITDAFVAAYNSKGQKISVKEANTLLNN